MSLTVTVIDRPCRFAGIVGSSILIANITMDAASATCGILPFLFCGQTESFPCLLIQFLDEFHNIPVTHVGHRFAQIILVIRRIIAHNHHPLSLCHFIFADTE